MKKHKFKIVIGLLLVGFTLVAALLPKETKSDLEIKTTISELNSLAENIIANSQNLDAKSIETAQKNLDEKKGTLKLKVDKLKALGDFQFKPEIAKDLNDCLTNNPKKIIEVYDKILEKNANDIKELNNLKAKYKPDKSVKNFKAMESSANTVEANIKLINAFAELVNGFISIFSEEKN